MFQRAVWLILKYLVLATSGPCMVPLVISSSILSCFFYQLPFLIFLYYWRTNVTNKLFSLLSLSSEKSTEYSSIMHAKEKPRVYPTVTKYSFHRSDVAHKISYQAYFYLWLRPTYLIIYTSWYTNPPPSFVK